MIAKIICILYLATAASVYVGGIISIWRMDGWKSAVGLMFFSVGGAIILVFK